MTAIYAIEKDRRKSSSTYDHEGRRKNSSIQIETVRELINLKLSEQNKLWDLLEQRDSKKINIIKITFAIFSIFVSGLLAIFVLVQKPNEFILTYEFIALFSIVLVGIGLINFCLIKYIISFKHARVLFIRQINCLRHNLDACTFALVVGRFPINDEELHQIDGFSLEQQNMYIQTFGKHRKLPIENNLFRDYHQQIFESPDNLVIIVISTLSLILASLPLVYFWNTENSNIMGAIIITFAIVYGLSVRWLMNSAKRALNVALQHYKS